MTTAVARSTASLNIPQTQNTAPVHEFRCLFTHDLRRKQKRWQDGLLKFHTFNKRVMVYDDVRNFIGDTHWKEGSLLQTDDEITLNEGILVQIGDALRTTQTDLTPLLERERKKPDEAVKRPALGLSTAARQTLGGQTTRNQMLPKKHRSLNALLGTPRGSYGRANLAQSPYDAKHGRDENEGLMGSISKRRRVGGDKAVAQPQSVTGMAQASPSKEIPSCARNVDARDGPETQQKASKAKKRAAPEDQAKRVTTEIVDITSDNEPFPSDVTLPSTPPDGVRRIGMQTIEKSRPRHGIMRRNIPPEIPLPPASPPVSTKNRFKNVQNHLEEDHLRSDPASPIVSQAHTPKRKALRLGKSQSRSMLLCQNPVANKPALSLSRTILPDPMELSDFEEISPPKSIKKKAVKTAPGQSKEATAISRNHDNLIPDAIRDVRDSSSPEFSTSTRHAGHFESPPLPFNLVDEANNQPSLFPKQRKQKSPPRSNELARMDQRLLSKSSKAPKSNAKTETRRPELGASVDPADRPFRRVQSESIAVLPIILDEDFETRPAIMEEASLRAVAFKLNSNPLANAATLKTAFETTKKRLTGKQPLQRAMSLNSVIERSKPKPKQMEKEKSPFPAKDASTGPWTVEATDLFDWRPPDWDERVKKMTERVKKMTAGLN
jgi:hypothetical protein